jgi:hypothetical protein
MAESQSLIVIIGNFDFGDQINNWESSYAELAKSKDLLSHLILSMLL